LIVRNKNVLSLQIVIGVNVRGGRRMLLLAGAFLPRNLAEILREARCGAAQNQRHQDAALKAPARVTQISHVLQATT
jgi:hypothetical protein